MIKISSQRALIFSDARAGHENQSKAFCQLNGYDYEICHVSYSHKIFKILSYLLDFLGIRAKIFITNDMKFHDFDVFVGAGSSTYYAIKFYAKKYSKKSVAIMLPKGYRKNFDLIIANSHDHPIPRHNQLVLPVSISNCKPSGFYTAGRKSIGFVIGGSNQSFEMNDEILNQIKKIRAEFNKYEFVLTTSPRTPKNIESALQELDWAYSVIFSKEQVNPIGDFLSQCEWVFISIDSVSMISEAVANGTANIGIIDLKRKNSKNKFDQFINALIATGHARKYGKDTLKNTTKYDLKELIKGIKI